MDSKEKFLSRLDPNDPGISGYLFGLPFSEGHADVIIVPVPWEVTVSSGSGTACAPEAICEASLQVDLFMRTIPDAWKLGIHMLPAHKDWVERGLAMRSLAAGHIRSCETGDSTDKELLYRVNIACEQLVAEVKEITARYMAQDKLVGILGGDHSTPLGFIHALGERYAPFGILQIDAHADLRKAYEGFVYSHASIMHHALQMPEVERLVQVGIRDFCHEEYEVMKNAGEKLCAFFDEDLKAAQCRGESWQSQCEKIISCLPDNVYISFDIDGLDPKLCPHTGTPVPGGLEFHQAAMLIAHVVRSGRKIIGFDLSEVAPVGSHSWDANVAARLLYLLCNWMAVSQGRLTCSIV